MADEVKLEWVDLEDHSWIKGEHGKGECWEQRHYWTALLGAYGGYDSWKTRHCSRDSAKAAVSAELKRRNRAEWDALEKLDTLHIGKTEAERFSKSRECDGGRQ